MIFDSDDKISVINMDGSGKTNILITDNQKTSIYTYYSGNQAFSYISPSPPTTYSKIYHGDFNGDGIPDIIELTPVLPDLYHYIFYYNNAEVKFGGGSGTYETAENPLTIPLGISTQITVVTKYNLYIADINGDGKDDIIQTLYNESLNKTSLHIYYSKGYANRKYLYKSDSLFFDGNYSNYGDITSGFLWHLGDFNGDGTTDLLIRKSTSDTQPKIIYFNKNEQYEYVKEIKDGLGKKHTITYTPAYLSFISSSAKQARKAFVYLPSKLQTSNGIGNNLTELQFSYGHPFYSVKRKSFMGFREFITKNTENNITTTDSLYFITDDLYNSPLEKPIREILLPYRKVSRINVDPYTINQIDYSCQTVDLTNNRFILHNKFIKNINYLSDTKTETTTTLENGRVKTSNTKTFNSSNSITWLHSETNTYTYNTITLNGNQKKTVPAQILTSQQYGIAGKIITDTTTYSYYTDNTNNGHLKSVRQGNLDGSITTTYSNYTPAGLCQTKTVSAQNVASRTETYTYDATNRFITKITNPLGHYVTMNYNLSTGNKLSETDANRLITTYNYDSFGRLKQINYPDGIIIKDTLYWHTASNPQNARYCSKTTSTGKSDVIVYYDILGREVCRKEDGYYYETRYNNKGQIIKTSLPFYTFYSTDTVWSYYTYDNFGRIKTKKAPYVNLSYSYNNRKVTVTDDLRPNVTSYKDYDALGRITQAQDEGGTINYSYSIITSSAKLRHQTQISTNGSTTTVLTDMRGNRVKLTEPDAGEITCEYNNYNELTKQTDAKDDVTTYQYDLLGRITQKVYNLNGETVTLSYSYDSYGSTERGIGKINSVWFNYNDFAEFFNYDHLGRLKIYAKSIDPNTLYTFKYTYNANGQLDTLTYPNNFAVKYTYDNAGRLATIQNASNNNLIYKTYEYNAFGQLLKGVFPI
jgi:YD repeat-containing protein